MQRALLLDRDGVINIEKNYVHRIEDFEFNAGIFDLCQQASKLGFKLIVITNQAGIARGYYTIADYEKLTRWMLKQFAARGIHIDRIFFCPFHPTEGIDEYRRNSLNRKPNPGMILQARDAFNLDLPGSVLVGDKASDIEAGRAAGIGHNILLSTEASHAGGSGALRFSSLAAITTWFRQTFSPAGQEW
jgi:D-glycero-D-manno-heptose 1,7-bisphosphate phosphatase